MPAAALLDCLFLNTDKNLRRKQTGSSNIATLLSSMWSSAPLFQYGQMRHGNGACGLQHAHWCVCSSRLSTHMVCDSPTHGALRPLHANKNVCKMHRSCTAQIYSKKRKEENTKTSAIKGNKARYGDWGKQKTVARKQELNIAR